MKRHGDLFAQMTSFSGLCQAAREAAKGKKHQPEVARFLWDLEPNVLAIQRELRAGTYTPGAYHTFRVHDPKERRICAAGFRDRVVQHALCQVIEPVLEKSLVFDTYACRRGKGTHRALARARGFCRRYAYFAKMDVHLFYDSGHSPDAGRSRTSCLRTGPDHRPGPVPASAGQIGQASGRLVGHGGSNTAQGPFSQSQKDPYPSQEMYQHETR